MTGVLDLITVIDAVIVVFAGVVLYYSVRLIRLIDIESTVFRWRWWSLLPLVTLYGFAGRVMLLIAAGGLAPEWFEDTVIASFVVFWAGLAVFLYFMYTITADLTARVKK